jgi:hypothetical protein
MGQWCRLEPVFIVDDIRQAADDAALALTLAGYRADFSPSSLWEVDRLFDDAGSDLAGSLGDPAGLGHALFAIGGYVGEVVRRRRGGRWIGDDQDPEAEINIELSVKGGARIWPVQRAMKRYKNGSEDSMVAYGVGLGLELGDRPTPPGALARMTAVARHDANPSAYRKFRRWRARRRNP